MSYSRPKLKLDEQSFQDMLAAAFTIQEHNARRKRVLPPEHVCAQCGAPAKEGELLCGRCAGDDLRPGEQMQRKWASLWLMSQEQGLWPERSTEAPAKTPEKPVPTEIQALHFPDVLEIPIEAEEPSGPTTAEMDREWPGTALAELRAPTETPLLIPEVELPSPEISSPETTDEDVVQPQWNLRELRLKLRFHRADLYLVVAIVVSTFAMIWVLSATPASSAQRKPRLSAWERTLVSMGLAEAPETPPRRGDPNIQVWVDPKTALYYCAGEDLYGKAPGGHLTTQGEAQMDSFEPAGRAPCE